MIQKTYIEGTDSSNRHYGTDLFVEISGDLGDDFEFYCPVSYIAEKGGASEEEVLEAIVNLPELRTIEYGGEVAVFTGNYEDWTNNDIVSLSDIGREIDFNIRGNAGPYSPTLSKLTDLAGWLRTETQAWPNLSEESPRVAAMLLLADAGITTEQIIKEESAGAMGLSNDPDVELAIDIFARHIWYGRGSQFRNLATRQRTPGFSINSKAIHYAGETSDGISYYTDIYPKPTNIFPQLGALLS